MTTYGKIIANERETKNMSRRSLAVKTGVAETNLRRIEGGEGKSNPDDLQKIARALTMNESKLIEAWLVESLKGIDYDPDLLNQVRKPDMDFDQIETMYGIDKARAAYEKIKLCTTGKKMKAAKESTLLEIRVALKNCLGLIDDLREG